jgi:hypothetical protein
MLKTIDDFTLFNIDQLNAAIVTASEHSFRVDSSDFVGKARVDLFQSDRFKIIAEERV